jgi:UDP-glucose 4-epimerase
MNKKIVVTGGAGFIGSAIIKHLKSEGHEIFVIDNLSFGNRNFIDVADDHFFNEDILDREKMESVITAVDPEWVIHLAAIHFIPYCNEHPFEAANINIQGTINVYDACKKLPKLERLFFASTAAVYPISDDAVSEEHRLCPLDVYGLSKLTGERLSREFHLETGVPTIICRFFNAFGPNETNPHLIPEIQQQINSGKRTIQLGNLEPKRDFIHTYDMARAVISLLKSDIQFDVFNLGRGIEYSVREIVEAFERELGEEISIEQDPDRMRKTDRMHLLANVSKLKSAIGWEPEWNIDQGVKTLIDK